MPSSSPRCVLLMLVALSLPACQVMRFFGLGGDDPEWQEAAIEGVTPRDALRIVRAEVERHGYGMARVDPFAGELESSWLYGLYSNLRNQDLRQRVFAEVAAAPEGDGVTIRLRVQREINAEMGRLREQEDGDWGAFEDNVATAQALLTRISHVLREAVNPHDDIEPVEGEDAG